MSTTATLHQTAPKSRVTAGAYQVLQRKCACGSSTSSVTGECEACSKKKRLGLQAKLVIGAANDPLEHEANRVADQVLATPTHAAAGTAPPHIQRFPRQSGSEAATAPVSVGQALATPGSPMEPGLRHDMELRFGHDFSRVRVHTGAAADTSAQEVGALAYTVGHHVVFGSGQFLPGNESGRHLLAHELTHVVQQSGTDGSTTNHLMRQPAGPGVCDPANLGTLGPKFALPQTEVEKLKLPTRTLRAALPGETDFSLYCPHRASIPIGDLVATSTVYFIGSGKVKGKDEVWTRVDGHDGYFWGFIKDDKYIDKITAKPPPKERKKNEDEPKKKGVCGPDVTKQLSNGVTNMRKDFRAKSADQREEMCDQIHSLVHGPVTWDFPRLHVRNWMSGIRDTCATVVSNKDEACCANSVQVGKDCYYAGSANYVLFGAICRECFDFYLNRPSVDLDGVYAFRSKGMLSLIESYKSDAWNFKKSQQWASVGYEGWPSGATAPSGDCSSDCSSNCPLPFFIEGGTDNEAFRARWCPHLDPVGACKSWSSNFWDLTPPRAKQ